jgi:ABC-type multidrug transport system permease subunit
MADKTFRSDINSNIKSDSSYHLKFTYLKVLLTKDFLTLWRNKGYLIAFIIMPLILLFSFVGLTNSILNVDGEYN